MNGQDKAYKHSIIEVNLTEKEYKFLKWLAKRDEVNYSRELQLVFYTELRQLQDLYQEEMEMEEEGKL